MNKILSSALFAIALTVSIAAYAEETKPAEVSSAETPSTAVDDPSKVDEASKTN